MLRRWAVSILRYEQGVAQTAWRMSLRNSVWWKSLGFGLVWSAVVSTILTNFDAVTQGYGSGYGVKAACSALGAATLAFMSIIPGNTPRLDIGLRIASATLAVTSGVFWLLSETGGKAGLFLGVLAPTAVAMLFAMLAAFVLLSVNNWETAYKRSQKEDVENHKVNNADEDTS